MSNDNVQNVMIHTAQEASLRRWGNVLVGIIERLVSPITESATITVRSSSKVNDEKGNNETNNGDDLEAGKPELEFTKVPVWMVSLQQVGI